MTKTQRQVADDVDDRFNLRFGGIMDEDIREAAPLATIKPSHVKVSTPALWYSS
jgi:hypothetical protein